MIHWLPIRLSADDANAVREILPDPPTISGGGAEIYELMGRNGRVRASVPAANFRQAGVHFINTTWIPEDHAYTPGVPIEVRHAVVDAVERRDMCTCTGECTDPECDARAMRWGAAYVRDYAQKAGSPPPSVTVRHDGETRTFTPTLVMLDNPGPDAILDGVLGKMQIHMS